jgi:multiple sugar transport system permease protein
MNTRRLTTQLIVFLLSLTLAIIIIGPVLWGVLLSLKTRVDALSLPPALLFRPTLENYKAALIDGPYLRTLLNSIFIASLTSLLSMAFALPTAYAFSRGRFRWQDPLFLGVLTVRMAPPTVIALPFFLIFSRAGLLDTYIPIVLVHTGITMPLAIWILKSFIDEVPVALDEASLLDGDSRQGVLWKQILPACAAGVMVTTGFCFVNSWNEFFLALTLTGYQSRPFTVAVPALITPHGTYWGQVTAIATMGLFPGLLFAAFARKYIIKELTLGSIRS